MYHHEKSISTRELGGYNKRLSWSYQMINIARSTPTSNAKPKGEREREKKTEENRGYISTLREKRDNAKASKRG